MNVIINGMAAIEQKTGVGHYIERVAEELQVRQADGKIRLFRNDDAAGCREVGPAIAETGGGIAEIGKGIEAAIGELGQADGQGGGPGLFHGIYVGPKVGSLSRAELHSISNVAADSYRRHTIYQYCFIPNGIRPSEWRFTRRSFDRRLSGRLM